MWPTSRGETSRTGRWPGRCPRRCRAPSVRTPARPARPPPAASRGSRPAAGSGSRSSPASPQVRGSASCRSTSMRCGLSRASACSISSRYRTSLIAKSILYVKSFLVNGPRNHDARRTGTPLKSQGGTNRDECGPSCPHRRRSDRGPVGVRLRRHPARRDLLLPGALALGRMLAGTLTLAVVLLIRREGLPPRAAWPGS